jgi:nitrate reductase NapD
VSDEYNVCGVLVHTRPGNAAVVSGRLAALPGVEVHAATEEGRLVVTVEDTPERLAIDTITEIVQTEGVINASLVYQYTDDEALLQESAP